MSSSPFNDAVLDELSCPICLEDFEEPKCLPNCAHNVCKGCLEDIIKARPSNRRHINCPICRGNVPIPREGISAIPTNTMIKRLLEKASVPRAEKEIMKALERSKEKIEALRKSAQKPGQSFAADDDVKAKGEALKRIINDKASKITKMIKSQEEIMIAKVNDYVKKYADKDPVKEISHLLERLELSVKQAEEVLRQPNNSKKVQSKAAIVKMLEASCHFDVMPSKGSHAFDLDFFPNEDLEQRLKAEWFGKLAKESEESLATKHLAKVTVVKTITADDIGETSFNPYTIALSAQKGEMAVLDDESNRVHILTQSGNYLRSFGVKFGDLYDVAFQHDKYLDGVIVVNRSHNRLLAYHRESGRFSPMFYSSMYESVFSSQFSKGNFSSVSTTPDGQQIIVTSEALDESCVAVINVQPTSQQKNNFVFGKGYLLCPRKALYYNKEFFVCDRDDGVVKVFDAKGACQREIGEDLECPRGIAIDGSTANILVADPGTDSVQAFNTSNGAFVGKIVLDEAPVSIGINTDGHAVVCYHDTEPCLKILSYRL
ncbi:uncharacterized protein LOC144659389 [Oculina patagonica]